MTHKEKALTYFSQKYHCSQAILAAYCEELGITEEQALKVAYCFNSGMRKGEVCGACAGALLQPLIFRNKRSKNKTPIPIAKHRLRQVLFCYFHTLSHR